MENNWQKKHIKTRDAWNDAFKDYRLLWSRVYFPELSLLIMEPKINILTFEDIIREIHKDSQSSTNDIVLKNYGKEALAILNEVCA